MKLHLSFIICLLLISSCTVEKRLYSKGFHVEWKRSIKTKPGNSQELNPEAQDNDRSDSEDLQVENTDSIVVQESERVAEEYAVVDEVKESTENDSYDVVAEKQVSRKVALEDEREVGEDVSPWAVIFPSLFVIGGTIMPFLAMSTKLILLLYVAMGLMILGHALFSLFRRKARLNDDRYDRIVAAFYGLSLTVNIGGTMIMLLVEWVLKGLSYDYYLFEVFMPAALIYYWVLFTLLLISIINQVRASKDQPLPKDFTIKMIFAVILFAICVFKTITLII